MRARRARPGIQALASAAGRDLSRATCLDLGFTLGPRLNAAGRLEDMAQGIECLVTADADRATALAQRLDALNRERRGIESDMQASALASLENVEATPGWWGCSPPASGSAFTARRCASRPAPPAN
jgi:single-stranded-DNA-specific exonuclease